MKTILTSLVCCSIVDMMLIPFFDYGFTDYTLAFSLGAAFIFLVSYYFLERWKRALTRRRNYNVYRFVPVRSAINVKNVLWTIIFSLFILCFDCLVIMKALEAWIKFSLPAPRLFVLMDLGSSYIIFKWMSYSFFGKEEIN